MSKLNWTLSTTLAVAALVISAPQARGQQLHLGTFKLAVEAHFGTFVLQPGEYDISRIEGMSAIRVRGEGGTATILANSIDSQAELKRSTITLVNVNGVFALKRFDAGALGRRYDFVPDKKSLGKNSERASVGHETVIEVGTK